MKKIKLMSFVVVACLLLGGGWFFFHISTSKEKSKELSADDILATIVETEPLTTNLKSGGYIQLSFKIQTSSKKAKEELEKRDFQVRNEAIQIISSMTEVQVKSPSGMGKIETEMKDALNKLMENGSIVQIYTTNKMIQ